MLSPSAIIAGVMFAAPAAPPAAPPIAAGAPLVADADPPAGGADDGADAALAPPAFALLPWSPPPLHATIVETATTSSETLVPSIIGLLRHGGYDGLHRVRRGRRGTALPQHREENPGELAERAVR
jgi:hypothetical protein